MKKELLTENLVIDFNLLYLNNLLLDLDNYSFDNDVLKLLNRLKCVVEKKLYSNLKYPDLNAIKEELIIKYYYENE